MFEKANKNIKVKLVNAGQGETEYEKLRTALKAGSGAPDVVHMEFQFIPTFRQIDGLADISEYGANDYKSDFAPWTWAQVSEGDAVYAMPWDSGPMALLYRKDVFDQYGLEVPATWDQFAQEAEKLHKADSETYLADFTPTDGGWITGLMWQAGRVPSRSMGRSSPSTWTTLRSRKSRSIGVTWSTAASSIASRAAPTSGTGRSPTAPT